MTVSKNSKGNLSNKLTKRQKIALGILGAGVLGTSAMVSLYYLN